MVRQSAGDPFIPWKAFGCVRQLSCDSHDCWLFSIKAVRITSCSQTQNYSARTAKTGSDSMQDEQQLQHFVACGNWVIKIRLQQLHEGKVLIIALMVTACIFSSVWISYERCRAVLNGRLECVPSDRTTLVPLAFVQCNMNKKVMSAWSKWNCAHLSHYWRYYTTLQTSNGDSLKTLFRLSGMSALAWTLNITTM